MCAKRFVQHFTGFSLSTRAVGHGLFDADDLTALRALTEEMTRAIDFVLWHKTSHGGQFWLFHATSIPQFFNLTKASSAQSNTSQVIATTGCLVASPLSRSVP